MSVHQTTTNHVVEVRPCVLDPWAMVRVWDTAPGGPLGDHVIVADLRFTVDEAELLIEALQATVAKQKRWVNHRTGADRYYVADRD